MESFFFVHYFNIWVMNDCYLMISFQKHHWDRLVWKGEKQKHSSSKSAVRESLFFFLKVQKHLRCYDDNDLVVDDGEDGEDLEQKRSKVVKIK